MLGAHMAEYRAYRVGLDGHFVGIEPLVCTDTERLRMRSGWLTATTLSFGGVLASLSYEHDPHASDVDAAMDSIVDEPSKQNFQSGFKTDASRAGTANRR